MNHYLSIYNQEIPKPRKSDTFLRSEWHTWVTRVLLTRWSGVSGEKLVVSELAKKFHTFCGTRRFITVFTKARQVNPIQVLTNQAHTLPSCFLHIHFNILQPRMKLRHLHSEGSGRQPVSGRGPTSESVSSLMTRTEIVPETVISSPLKQLTQFLAREIFTAFILP